MRISPALVSRSHVVVCTAWISRPYEIRHFYLALTLRTMSDSAVGIGSGSDVRTVENLDLRHKQPACGKLAGNKKLSRLAFLSGFVKFSCCCCTAFCVLTAEPEVHSIRHLYQFEDRGYSSCDLHILAFLGEASFCCFQKTCLFLWDEDNVPRRPLNRIQRQLDRSLLDGGFSSETFCTFLDMIVASCANESGGNNRHFRVRCKVSKNFCKKTDLLTSLKKEGSALTLPCHGMASAKLFFFNVTTSSSIITRMNV